MCLLWNAESSSNAISECLSLKAEVPIRHKEFVSICYPAAHPHMYIYAVLPKDVVLP